LPQPYGMIRRITALLGMVALLGLLALLIVEVQRHHRRGYLSPDRVVVEKIALPPALAA